MIKVVFSILFAFLFSVIQNAEAQSIDNILNEHFKASGQDQLNNINTVRSYGKALQAGNEFPFLQIQKRPDNIYLEIDIQGMKMVQAYDGEKGYAIEPWINPDPRDLTGHELMNLGQMASIDSDLVNWKEKGCKIEYVGREKYGDGKVFILKLIKYSGEAYQFYIDANSYLIRKIVTHTNYEGSTFEGETVLSDYRNINGIKVPFRTEMKYDGQTLMINIIENVEFDVVIEEKFFLRN